MTSQRQLEANRANAKRSTGPKTSGGKRNSRKNAVKHGLCSGDVVLWDEDPLEFEQLRKSLEGVYPPVNAVIAELVDHLAGLFWRLRRAPTFEAGIFGARGTLTIALQHADPAARQKALERLGHLRQARSSDRQNETLFYKDLGQALCQEIPTVVLASMGGENNHEILALLQRHETSLRNGIARTLSLLHALGAGPPGATRA